MSTGSSAHNSKIPLWAVAKIKEQQEAIRELVDALRTFADETGTAERQLAFELVKRHGENYEGS